MSPNQSVRSGGSEVVRPRVLVADDDDLGRAAISAALRSLGADVDAVPDGAEAIDDDGLRLATKLRLSLGEAAVL